MLTKGSYLHVTVVLLQSKQLEDMKLDRNCPRIDNCFIW